MVISDPSLLGFTPARSRTKSWFSYHLIFSRLGNARRRPAFARVSWSARAPIGPFMRINATQRELGTGGDWSNDDNDAPPSPFSTATASCTGPNKLGFQLSRCPCKIDC